MYSYFLFFGIFIIIISMYNYFKFYLKFSKFFLKLYYLFLFLYNMCFVPLISEFFSLPLVCDAFLIKMRDSVPSARYSPVCNVLRLWRIWLIPILLIFIESRLPTL